MLRTASLNAYCVLRVNSSRKSNTRWADHRAVRSYYAARRTQFCTAWWNCRERSIAESATGVTVNELRATPDAYEEVAVKRLPAEVVFSYRAQ